MELREDGMGRGSSKKGARDKEILHDGWKQISYSTSTHARKHGAKLYKKDHFYYLIRKLLNRERSDTELDSKFRRKRHSC